MKPFESLVPRILLPLILALWAAPGEACAPGPAWPRLAAWCQAVQGALDQRDAGLGYRRTVRVLAEPTTIVQARGVTTAEGDEVCAGLASSAGSVALTEIAQKLGVRTRLRTEVVNAAALELKEAAPRESFEHCESVALVEEAGAPPRYFQSFFFQMGPARLRRNVLISVTTEW